VFGEYVILDKIGAGRMGFVYRAKRRGMETVFALKVLPAQRLAESETARRRFQREIELHVRLSHPNIVRIHDAGEQNGVPYLVMELVTGQDLSALAKSRKLSVAETVDYILQAARGIAYAHGEGLIHRDIKPANLLLDVSGAVKILDMGLARLEDAEAEEGAGRLTLQMQLLGTPHYMAPEQAVDPRGADARADIYSLGCTWFYLLAGRAPYPRESKIDALMAHRDEPIPSLRALRDEVPLEIDAVFQRMMAKRAEDRFQSMADVIAALEDCQAALAAGQAAAGDRQSAPEATKGAHAVPPPLPTPVPAITAETAISGSPTQLAQPASLVTRTWLMVVAALGLVSVAAALFWLL
jgi:serine/threonine protein kinase